MRGLKWGIRAGKAGPDLSHPVRGAWIEIKSWACQQWKELSHPVRGAWIEIVKYLDTNVLPESHPVRGAWIEIYICAGP